MKTELRSSGLVVPVEKKPPEKPRGPLELVLERDEAAECFTTLLNLIEVRGGALGGSREKAEARTQVIRHVAELLLGEDVDFEILT